MKTKILLLFLLAVSTSLVSLKAQEKINLQQAIDMGTKSNPMLRISSAKIKIAEAKLEQMKEMDLPHASASLAYSHFNLYTPLALKFGSSPKPLLVIPAMGFSATIGSGGIQEELFAGFRVRSNIKSAELLLQAAHLNSENDKTTLSYTITAAYYNIYKIIKSQEIIDENMKDLDEKIRELSSAEKQGVVLHNDVLKVQLQRTNLELSKLELANTLQSALYNLKLMIGLPENNPVEIDTNNLLNNRPDATVADMQNMALTNRVELKANALQVKAAGYNVQAIKSAWYPSLGVMYSYYYINPANSIIPEKSSFINAGGPGVSLSYSLSSLWTTKGKIDEARANIAQLNSINDAQTNSIKSEVFTNYNNWMLTREKINVAQKAIDQSSENYRTTNSRYKNGVSTMTDLIDANTMLIQAQLNKITTSTDAELSYFKLINSTGK